MKIHPAAKAIPEMLPDEYAALKADIKSRGLIVPIETVSGQLLDGRHRFRACKELKIEPDTVEVALGGMSPAEYVWSVNGIRRHLTPSQRAAVAVELLPELQKAAKERQKEHGGTAPGRKNTSPKNGGSVESTKQAAALVGVSHGYVSDAQKLKTESPKAFQAVKNGTKTLPQAKRDIREGKRETKRKANAAKAKGTTPIESLDGIFSTLLVDPPWSWDDEGDVNQLGRAKPDYDTMTIDKLASLAVSKVTADDAHIYCWVTNRSLPKVFGLLDSWGFRYVTLLTWPKLSFGMGNYFRGQTEHIAFGVRGSLSLQVKDASTLLPTWKRGGKHSQKPSKIHAFIERCSPGPYLELFGRTQIANWRIWGADA